MTHQPEAAQDRVGHPPGSPAAQVAAFDARRLALVRAAYEIIAAEGFERLRTRDIAEKVGINVATLHYHFPTKEALIGAVALYLSAQFQTVHAPRTAPEPADALGRLRQEFDDARFYSSQRPEMLAVMQELNLRARRDQAIAAIVEPLKTYWRASLETIVAAGIREGLFADRSPHDAAAVVVAMLWGASTFQLSMAEHEGVYAAIEQWLLDHDPAKARGEP